MKLFTDGQWLMYKNIVAYDRASALRYLVFLATGKVPTSRVLSKMQKARLYEKEIMDFIINHENEYVTIFDIANNFPDVRTARTNNTLTRLLRSGKLVRAKVKGRIRINTYGYKVI